MDFVVDVFVNVVLGLITSDVCVDWIALDDSGVIMTVSEDPSNISSALPSLTVSAAGVDIVEEDGSVGSVFVETWSCSPSYS